MENRGQSKNLSTLKLALPKGRMETGVLNLLSDAGVKVSAALRVYRPKVSLFNTETKVLKPQNIIEMLALGSRDIGFAGADWIEELQVEVVQLLDTELDPIKLVAACPKEILQDGKLPRRRLVVASEYERLTKSWIERKNLDASFIKSFGATEVFPPEDADCIVDNTATGATLEANSLTIIDELMISSTRLYASPQALENPAKREQIENLVLNLKSVLDARKRVMLELNVQPENLDAVIEILPCMKMPTISSLHAGAGYAVKAAVPKNKLVELIPLIKAKGGTDIVIMPINQLVS
jgi:ATP phosphoribosyltransferase